MPSSEGSIIRINMGKYNDYLKNIQFRHAVKHNTDKGSVIEVVQDVSSIIEDNKRDYNQSTKKYSNELLGNHVMRLPLTVIDMLNEKGLMRRYHIPDQKAFNKWANDPENRHFKVKQGRL